MAVTTYNQGGPGVFMFHRGARASGDLVLPPAVAGQGRHCRCYPNWNRRTRSRRSAPTLGGGQ